MRDYMKAIEAVEQAADIDTEKKHVKEIQEQVWKCQQAMLSQREGESEEETLQRAMRDPEIAVRPTRLESSLGLKLTNIRTTENYERPDHAIHPPAGAVGPRCAPGSHEEPGRPPEHNEAHQCWYHQDSVVVPLRWDRLRVEQFYWFPGSDCWMCGSHNRQCIYTLLYDASVIQVLSIH
ncbi:hypothetical protein BD310DRAFT_218489 [Dichomitus squalens]|uniref:Uncharacterized protein n=1 Tax=Dichomitus squalens TaxID=114155 RepID=A0A4Q9Q255_9APHY|nr:hypothetical protein BD310DRAFT_218489 [Dichomitus squalens]